MRYAISIAKVAEWALSSDASSHLQRGYSLPKGGIVEMTDIKVMADADANNMTVTAGFDLILVDN